MKGNYISSTGKMEVTKILLLAGWLSLSLSPTLGEANCDRGKWKEQRAVNLAKELNLVSVSWMTASNGVKKYGDNCAGGGVTTPPGATTPGATTPAGTPTQNPATPPPEPSTSDECTKSTVSVHYFHDVSKNGEVSGNKEYIVISDLTGALKCENGKCVCAENGTKEADVDGTKLCIKAEAVEKHKECIHHAECKDKDLSCVYEARPETNGDCGEIEDMRRFCSGSRRIFPIALTLPVSFLIMLAPIISK